MDNVQQHCAGKGGKRKIKKFWDISRIPNRHRRAPSYRDPVGILLPDFFALSLPFLENVIFFVLELHCVPRNDTIIRTIDNLANGNGLYRLTNDGETKNKQQQNKRSRRTTVTVVTNNNDNIRR